MYCVSVFVTFSLLFQGNIWLNPASFYPFLAGCCQSGFCFSQNVAWLSANRCFISFSDKFMKCPLAETPLAPMCGHWNPSWSWTSDPMPMVDARSRARTPRAGGRVPIFSWIIPIEIFCILDHCVVAVGRCSNLQFPQIKLLHITRPLYTGSHLMILLSGFDVQL